MARPKKIIPDGDFQPDQIARKKRWAGDAGKGVQTSAPDPNVIKKKADLNTAKIYAKTNADEYESKTSGKNPKISADLRQKQIAAEREEYNYNNSRKAEVKRKKKTY
jgi:hypothetical protein